VAISESVKWDVWARDDFRCQHCGVRRFLSVDHIIPRAKNGSDAMENLQTLCWPCNTRKGARINGQVEIGDEMCSGDVTEILGEGMWQHSYCSGCGRLRPVRFGAMSRHQMAVRGYRSEELYEDRIRLSHGLGVLSREVEQKA